MAPGANGKTKDTKTLDEVAKDHGYASFNDANSTKVELGIPRGPRFQRDLLIEAYCHVTGQSMSGCGWFVGGVLAWFVPGPGWLAKIVKGVKVAKAAAAAADRACRANSFTGDTKVLMADGTRKPISKIKVGDKVLATDPETGRTEARRITATITSHGQKRLVTLSIDTDGPTGRAVGIITATENPPVWAESRDRWIEAGELTNGDTLRTPQVNSASSAFGPLSNKGRCTTSRSSTSIRTC